MSEEGALEGQVAELMRQLADLARSKTELEREVASLMSQVAERERERGAARQTSGRAEEEVDLRGSVNSQC